MRAAMQLARGEALRVAAGSGQQQAAPTLSSLYLPLLTPIYRLACRSHSDRAPGQARWIRSYISRGALMDGSGSGGVESGR